MTQEGQGNVPKPIQDEIAAEESLVATLDRLAGESEREAQRLRNEASWHRGRIERLRENDWHPDPEDDYADRAEWQARR